MKEIIEAPLEVQLRFHASSTEVVDLIPSQGTEITRAFWFDQKRGKIE